MFNGMDSINMMSNGACFKKRERTQNWNQEEKEQLLDLCRNEVHVIENKRYDSRHTEAKTRVWNMIHQNFSLKFGAERSVNRLKEQWRRMKAAARAEMHEYKVRLSQIGVDHTNIRKPSNFTFKVCDLLDEANRLCELEQPRESLEELFNSLPHERKLLKNIESGSATKRQEQELDNEEACEPPRKYMRLKNYDNNDGQSDDTSKTCSSNNNNKMNKESDNDSNEFDDECESLSIAEERTESLLMRSDDSAEDNLQQLNSELADAFNQLDLLKMQQKEHLLRMKILKAQLKYTLRTGQLLEVCRVGMESVLGYKFF